MREMWKRVLGRLRGGSGSYARGDLVTLVRFGRTQRGVVLGVEAGSLVWAGVGPETPGTLSVDLETGEHVRLEARLWPLDDATLTKTGERLPKDKIKSLDAVPKVEALTTSAPPKVGDVVSWQGGKAARCVVVEAGTKVLVSALVETSGLPRAHGSAPVVADMESAGLSHPLHLSPMLHLVDPAVLTFRLGRLSSGDQVALESIKATYNRATTGDVVESPEGVTSHMLVVKGGLLPTLVPVVKERRSWNDVVEVDGWYVVGAPRQQWLKSPVVVVGHVREDLAGLGDVVTDVRKLVPGGVYLLSTRGVSFKRALILRREPGTGAVRVVILPLHGQSNLEGLLQDLPQTGRTLVVSPHKASWAQVGQVDLSDRDRPPTPETVLAGMQAPNEVAVGSQDLMSGTVVRGEGGDKVVWEDHGDTVLVVDVGVARRNLSPLYCRTQTYKTTGLTDPPALSGRVYQVERTQLTMVLGILTEADLVTLQDHVAQKVELPCLESRLPRGAIVVASFSHPSTHVESLGTYVVWGDLDDMRDDGTADCVNALIARERPREGHYETTSSPKSGHDNGVWVWPHPVRISRGNLKSVQGILSEVDTQSLGEVVTKHLTDMVVPGRILWAPVEFKAGTTGKIRPLVVTRVEDGVATTLALSASTFSPLSNIRSYTLKDAKGSDLGRGGKVTDTRVMVDLKDQEFLLGRYLSRRDLMGVLDLEARTRRHHPTATLPEAGNHASA